MVRQADRRFFWRVFALLTIAAGLWSVLAPPLTGPDELSHARRAAAVVRGQLTGEPNEASPVLATVSVPEVYEVGDAASRCFFGPPVEGSPQPGMALPAVDCPILEGGRSIVEVKTGQHRGQPFYYAVIGLPTLLATGGVGFPLMRFVGLVICTALLASAALSLRRAAPGPLTGLLTFGMLTPSTLYLAAVTNPSGIEIAAALSAWSAGLLITRSDPGDVRPLTPFGISMVILVATRGLGPMFAAMILAAVAVLLGPKASLAIARSAAGTRWLIVGAVASVMSIGWLLWIQKQFPLLPGPNTGASTALAHLPWFLRQTVAMFGSNDSAASLNMAILWSATMLGLSIAGLVRAPKRIAGVCVATFLAALAVTVSAEAWGFPPAGSFWQGRYGYPLLVGGFVLAAGAYPANPVRTEQRPRSDVLVAVAALLLLSIHLAGFLALMSHDAARSGARLGLVDTFLHPRWTPAIPYWVALILYMVTMTTTAYTLITGRTRLPTPCPKGTTDYQAYRPAGPSGDPSGSPSPAGDTPKWCS